MPVAPYQRVVAEIRQRITDGAWPPGQQIPSRAHLATELDVGQGSVRRAMTILRRSGELDGTARSRLFVAHPPAVRTLINPDGNWPYLTGDGGGAGTCRADHDLAARLGVREGTRLRWERIECLDPDSRPSHLVTTWWVGRRSVSWARSVSVARAHELTAAEAEYLGLVAGTRTRLVERTRYGEDGQPIEVADLVLPDDRWRTLLA